MAIRILIADDHDIVAEGLAYVITAQPDMEVVGRAVDGSEAVRWAFELRPDVVVMDIAMPGINGIEAARDVCKRDPHARVIMLSMHTNPEYVYRSLEAGAIGYLVKRTAARELVNAIRTVHAGKRFFGEQIAENVISRYVGSPERRDLLGRLSQRERQVLRLLAEGKTVAGIAELLRVSPKTVETYRTRLYTKLELADLPGLVRFAIRHGITPIE